MVSCKEACRNPNNIDELASSLVSTPNSWSGGHESNPQRDRTWCANWNRIVLLHKDLQNKYLSSWLVPALFSVAPSSTSNGARPNISQTARPSSSGGEPGYTSLHHRVPTHPPLREGRQVEISWTRKLPPSSLLPNHIKFRTCSALAPMWTPPINESAELVQGVLNLIQYSEPCTHSEALHGTAASAHPNKFLNCFPVMNLYAYFSWNLSQGEKTWLLSKCILLYEHIFVKRTVAEL